MHLAGQVKMGYYPTPPGVVDLIRTYLAFAARPVNALDPCCGEGLALEQLTRGTNAITYGIELDAERARAAAPRLRHVVHAGYEDLEVSPECMGLLFLNPPYDDGEDERKELTFLRDLLPTLAPGGVLVYIVQQPRLSAHVIACLAAHFERIEVHRFPDADFAAFRQVVILARKVFFTSDAECERAKASLARAASDSALPPLKRSPWPRYDVPETGRATLEVRTVQPGDLVAISRSSPIWTRVDDLTVPPSTESVGQPPTPLHVGHLGLLLASGLLNGAVGDGDDRHLVVGKPVKHVVESVEVENDGDADGETEVTRRLETFRVTIKVLRPDGRLIRLV